jgi:hypothetical protein
MQYLHLSFALSLIRQTLHIITVRVWRFCMLVVQAGVGDDGLSVSVGIGN